MSEKTGEETDNQTVKITINVSTTLDDFVEKYKIWGGFMNKSEAMRNLLIIGKRSIEKDIDLESD